jgi:hypothetical protein
MGQGELLMIVESGVLTLTGFDEERVHGRDDNFVGGLV